MMSVSGIGWIVASQLLARIGDWRELRNIRQLGGFLGLVPAELREFFRLICHRHPRREGPRVAIVAVARKLSVRISVVLMQQRPYIMREKVHSAPLTQEETSPQGTTRR